MTPHPFFSLSRRELGRSNISRFGVVIALDADVSANTATDFASDLPQRARIEAGGSTHVGHSRSTNEDAFLIATFHRSINVQQASPGAGGWFPGQPVGTLLIVADGMGGHAGGEIASSTAVKAVTNNLLNVMPWVQVRAARGSSASLTTGAGSTAGLRGELSTAVLAGDETVKATGAYTGRPDMGTTLTTALVLWPFVYIAHVGDTRCYLFEAGQLRCLTTDHSLAQKFVEASAEPVEPPERLKHVLWNALGGADRAVPDVSKVELGPDAVLLLCSDGLNKHVSDATIADVLASNTPSAERAAKLVELANAGGGTDNITAIVAHVRAS